MESHVRVKILHEMRLNEWSIEGEPVGWFCFEEASQFNTLPKIFIQFVQQHLKGTECCKNSSSQILFIFHKEEEEHTDIHPEISNCIKTVCSMEPEEGELKNIYFPRLWGYGESTKSRQVTASLVVSYSITMVHVTSVQ